jgi:hypothetical protein
MIPPADHRTSGNRMWLITGLNRPRVCLWLCAELGSYLEVALPRSAPEYIDVPRAQAAAILAALGRERSRP